ncbi:TPA: hypothetical protein ACWP7O_004340 [Escherichia coli]
MTTFTDDDKKLIKEIKERISSPEVRDDIERRAYEIALASLEAEPVAWLHSDNGLGIPAITRSKNIADSWLSKSWYVQPLYIAKPVPVEPDARPSLNNGIVGFDEGWNACRAAMIHAGNFRENLNSSTNNFREIAETSTNSPAIPDEVLSAILKVARVRADFDASEGDRRGIGGCLDEAEQELIVTINKYASQIAAKPPQEEKSGNADCTATSGKTDNPQASGKQVDELTMLVKRLASSLKSVNKSSKLPDKAMDYLLRNGLVSVEGRGR